MDIKLDAVLGCDLQQDDVVVYKEQLMLVYLVHNKLMLTIIDTTERKCRYWYKIAVDQYYHRVTVVNPIDLSTELGKY